MSEGLSKSERIRSEGRISILFSEGRRGSAGPVKYLWRVTSPEPGPNEEGNAPKNDVPGVAVMFSVPKKAFKRAWKRNLIKRRMKEGYRRRKASVVGKAMAGGLHIDIAFICGGIPVPGPGEKSAKKRMPAPVEIPDFKTIDQAVAKILEQIEARIA